MLGVLERGSFMEDEESRLESLRGKWERKAASSRGRKRIEYRRETTGGIWGGKAGGRTWSHGGVRSMEKSRERKK